MIVSRDLNNVFFSYLCGFKGIVSIVGEKYILFNILLFIFIYIFNFFIKMNKIVNYKSNEIFVIVNYYVL